MSQLKKKLYHHQKEYNTACKNSDQLRQTYLEDIANAKELNGEGKKATILRTILDNEQQQKTFRRIKSLQQQVGSTATTFVNVTQPDGSKRSISAKEELESAIINENVKKYHQCENTPFLQEPLYTQFGRYGEGPATEKVKNGTYVPPADLDEVTKDFLHECHQSDSIKSEGPMPLKRSVAEFRQSWKVMKEKTSSRELHFGHFKAGMQHDLLSIVHWILAEIPFRTGYSPQRWQNATDVMILKKLGVYDVEALRTIVLYESDFNHNNKWLGRSMMHKLVTKKRLAPEQYSIPGRKAIDHALNRRLMFDLVRYQKTSLAMSSCDLKSNYDRIGHTPSVLCSNRLGIPAQPMYSMFHTIQEAKHYTRTAYGDSTITYGGLDVGFTRRPQGVGQGNAYGPPGWAVISSTLFDMMRRKGFGTKIVTPITNETKNLVGFAFVDDTDVLASTPRNNNPDTTMQKMQQTITYWEKAAKVTGGAIAPSKSWYYLIHFEWKNGKWSYGDMNNVLEDSLKCLDKNNVIHELRNKAPSEATEMLGVFLAPDGNNDKQLEEFLSKSKKMQNCLNQGHLCRYEAWTALTRVSTKSLEYPLPAMTFSKHQCRQYMTPLLHSHLPKAGINRNFPRALLYGTKEYGGLGLHDPYLLQGIHHIADIMEHTWKQTPTGHFLQCNIESMKAELGINGAIFMKDYKSYGKALLTQSLVRDTWKFSTEHNITFNENSADFTTIRENDTLFMDIIFTKVMKQYWASINRCRHYLRILTTSDIATGDGKRLHNAVYTGLPRCESSHNNNIIWPLWDKPKPTDWTIWRREIPLAFTGTNGGNTLINAIGPWLEPPKRWSWFTTPDHQKLYYYSNNQCTAYTCNSYSARVLTFSPIGHPMNEKPNKLQLIPTTVTRTEQLIVHEGTYSTVIPSTINIRQPPTSPKVLYFTKKLQMVGRLNDILAALNNGDAIVVSDGSFDPQTKIATAAWTIYANDDMHITGLVHVPGCPDYMDSYRAELAGILGIFEYLVTQQSQQTSHQPEIKLFCDGKSVLDRLQYLTPDNCSIGLHHSDMLAIATKLRQQLSMNITLHHVKGHQDNSTHYNALPLPARLNIQMDALAKTYRSHIQRTLSTEDWHHALQHPLTFIPVYHDNNLISGNPKTSIYKHIMQKQQVEYWIGKHKFPQTSAASIAWPSIAKATQASRLSRQHFIAKWNSHQLATGTVMKRWDKRALDKCPFCPHSPEITDHILLCQSTEVQSHRDESLNTFYATLRKADTSPLLLEVIEKELQHWATGSRTNLIHYVLPHLRPAILSQRAIGWQSFLEGFYSQEILDFQQHYYANKHSRKNAINWSSIAIRAGWTFISSMWQHRNEKIHNTPVAADLEGQQTLNAAISAELSIGRSRLPARFQHYFSITLESLLSRSLRERKNWFKSVRLARENLGDNNLLEDKFSIDKSYFRRWVGLP